LSDGNVNEHLVDDTLYAEFNKIKAKKIIFLDSCHSGTAFRSIGSKVKAKSISPNDVTQTFQSPAKMRGLSVGKGNSNSKDIITGSDYIVLSAARDNEESLATPTGSLFTNAIYQTFTNSKYTNEPLNSIDTLLVKDVLAYAKETNSIPHHPEISFSNSSIKSKSLNEFLNTTISSSNNQITKVQKTAKQHTVSNKKSSLEKTFDSMIANNQVKKMSIDYKKSLYNTGESVQFTIDTKGDRGYLTIFYVDGSDVTILYPNPYIDNHTISGKYKFPDDLSNGKFTLEAYKSCNNCQEERTVIYTLLSSQPVTDINRIKAKGGLLSFPKESQESKIMTRAVRIKAVSKTNTNTKPQLGKYKFIVKWHFLAIYLWYN